MRGVRGGSLFRGALLFFLAALAGGLLLFAGRLTLDYFDGYENLLNARAFALGLPDTVYVRRFYLLSILEAPLFLFERWTGWHLFGFRTAHALGVLFYLGAAALFYRMTRERLGKNAAFAATALMAVNPVTLQMAPFAKEDVPALFFLTGAAHFILRFAAGGRRSTAFWMTLFSAAAIACRYNLFPLMFLLYAAAAFGSAPALRRRMAASFLAAGGLFLAGGVLFFLRIERPSLPGAAAAFLGSFWQQYALKLGQHEPASENLRFLLLSVTAPVLMLAAVGAVRRIRSRRPDAVFFALWLFPMLVLQTFLVGGKEARYLLPFFPPLYFFVGEGIEGVIASLRSRIRPAGAAIAAAAVVAAALPAAGAARCLLRYGDPVYFDDFERRVSVRSAEVSETQKILWCGAPYALKPKDYLFDPADEFTHIYHFHAHTVRFYAPRAETVVGPYEAEDARRLGIGSVPFLLRPAGAPADDGDALIVNVSGFEDSSSKPAEASPLRIARARRYDFVPAAAGGYRCAALPAARIALDPQAAGTRLRASGLPAVPLNFYAVTAGKDVRPLETAGLARAGGAAIGTAIGAVATTGEKLVPASILVVTYEIVFENLPGKP